MRRLCRIAASGAILAVVAAPAQAMPERADARDARIAAAVRLMSELRAESVRHAARIRDAYGARAAVLEFGDRRQLRLALVDRRLVSLPRRTDVHNLRVRTRGKHPIGELDRAHQSLFIAARPQTIGCLLEVASRVRTGGVEVTSLVRHGEYQERLARRNANARTPVPTHVMGLAFDISILDAPLATAYEIRDVLRHMAAEGDLMFIAEQRQLVFHVVPAPRRRGYFSALAETLLTFPPDRQRGLRGAAVALHRPVPDIDLHTRGGGAWVTAAGQATCSVAAGLALLLIAPAISAGRRRRRSRGAPPGP